jgi:2,3-bisphosphoglycerate-dependent phosphoglycerate mutase
MMHFYLVRHGQSFVNLPDSDAINNPDEPLTPLGQEQAETVSRWIAENIDARHLYSSTITRARQTAEAINKTTGLSIEFDERLREIGTNSPDGRAIPNDQLPKYHENVWGTLYPYDPVAENGENWMQFRSRVGSFIESMLQQYDHTPPTSAEEKAEQSIIVVCHGGVIEAFFEYVFAKGPWSLVAVMTSNTGITHFRYQPREHRPDWILYYQNRLSHLADDMIS